MLINEASFEELVNTHTEGAFTRRKLAQAGRRQGAVPPLRIRQINASRHRLRARTAHGDPDASRSWGRPVGREAPHHSRDTARDVPLEYSPQLCGDTILAARWKHSISTDIDVLLPGRNTPRRPTAAQRRQHRRPAGSHPRSRRRRTREDRFSRHPNPLVCILDAPALPEFRPADFHHPTTRGSGPTRC